MSSHVSPNEATLRALGIRALQERRRALDMLVPSAEQLSAASGATGSRLSRLRLRDFSSRVAEMPSSAGLDRVGMR
jgi:hypothetical protein